jgi:hypothetical protein
MQRREWLGQLASQGDFFFRDCVPPLPLSSPSSSLIKWLNYPQIPTLPAGRNSLETSIYIGVGESPEHADLPRSGEAHSKTARAWPSEKWLCSWTAKRTRGQLSRPLTGLLAQLRVLHVEDPNLRSGSHDVSELSKPCGQAFEFSLTRGVNIGHTLRQA